MCEQCREGGLSEYCLDKPNPKIRLINTEYYSLTKEGNDIGMHFTNFVRNYIMKLAEDYDLIDLEHILVCEIQLLFAEHRIELAAKKTKNRRPLRGIKGA